MTGSCEGFFDRDVPVFRRECAAWIKSLDSKGSAD